MLTIFRSLTLLLLLVGIGCAPGRVADLRDSGRISLGIALGLSVDAKLGDLTHPALGFLSSAAMFGSESRDIDGWWYEARVSDPYATFWYWRSGRSLGIALNSSGWRGVWETLDWLDAIDEIDETFDQQAPEQMSTVQGAVMLDDSLIIGRWLPIPGEADERSPLWTFNTASDLQLGATLLLVGARVGFNPLEFLDLLLGFAGYDIAGDDPPAE
jgi:hypothetical protein